jgi:hypothetical protein
MQHKKTLLQHVHHKTFQEPFHLNNLPQKECFISANIIKWGYTVVQLVEALRLSNRNAYHVSFKGVKVAFA